MLLSDNESSSGIEVREFVQPDGKSPFARWYESLNDEAAAKVTMALYRLTQGNFSNVAGVGGGVFEYKVNFGPGYRIYFGNDGERLVILVGGSTKKDQRRAIARACEAWSMYLQSKQETEEGSC